MKLKRCIRLRRSYFLRLMAAFLPTTFWHATSSGNVILQTHKFSRALYFRGQVSKRENKGRKYCASITVITI